MQDGFISKQKFCENKTESPKRFNIVEKEIKENKINHLQEAIQLTNGGGLGMNIKIQKRTEKILNKEKDSQFQTQNKESALKDSSDLSNFLSKFYKEKNKCEDLIPKNTRIIHPTLNKIQYPLSPKSSLKYFKEYLSNQEKGELLNYNMIYYLGDIFNRSLSERENGNCPDEKNNDYKLFKNDQINYRYEVLSLLGVGSFGQTVKCLDHKTKEIVAIKIIKKNQKFISQGFVEVKLLKFCIKNDKNKEASVVKIIDHFMFRNHLCIAFELLSINLYDALKKRNFKVFFK